MGEGKYNLERRVDENNPEEMFIATMSRLIGLCRSANGSEIDSIIRLQASANNGEISKEEAVERAEEIAGGKQDSPLRP